MRFRTILADPPWGYSGAAGRGFRHIDHQYPTMAIPMIMGLPVADVAAPDSALLLWCTWPQMEAGLQVISAWGFRYVSGFPWVKMSRDAVPRRGIGFHTRGCSEFILIGVRGSCCPPPEARMDGVIFAPGGRHSAKPDDQYAFAEAYGGPHLEMFARPDHGGLFPPREGWTFIGNQATGRDIADDLRLLADSGK